MAKRIAVDSTKRSSRLQAVERRPATSTTPTHVDRDRTLGVLATEGSLASAPLSRRVRARRRTSRRARRLGLTLVARFLQNRRDFGIGDEVLPAFGIPVERHPDPVLLGRVAIDG